MQLRKIEVRKLSVVREFVDAKINRFVIRQISESFGNQRGDHLNHPVDVTLIGGSRIFVRALNTQRVRVVEERLFELFSEFLQRPASLARAPNRLVVHVRDVHYAMHVVTAQFEMALK